MHLNFRELQVEFYQFPKISVSSSLPHLILSIAQAKILQCSLTSLFFFLPVYVCWLYLPNMPSVWPSPPPPSWTKPPFSLAQTIAFQLVSNYSPPWIKVILVKHKASNHLISLLKSLQCLLVSIYVTSNVSTVTHEASSVLVHQYPSVLHVYHSSRLSSYNIPLDVPQIHLARSHLRTFVRAVHSAWDAFIWSDIFRAYSHTSFKSLLKYHLMREVLSESSIWK